MLRKYLIALVTSIAFVLFSCGGGDSFRISGEIKGLGTQNLTVIYYGDGAVRNLRTALLDGKFMFEAASRDWTTVYIFSNSRRLIGLVIAKNGESIQAKFNVDNPAETEIKGNKPSELLSKWIATHAEDLTSDNPVLINNAVKEFVTKNKDNIASTIALINYYHISTNPSQADSLFKLIDTKSRPNYIAEGWSTTLEMALDSTRTLLPTSLVFFDTKDRQIDIASKRDTLLLYLISENNRKKETDDSIAKRLKKLKGDSVRISFYEIDREMPDTFTWKKNVRNDSLTWKRLWHPFNDRKLPVDKDDIFLVTDSAGKVIYHGSDLNSAFKSVNL